MKVDQAKTSGQNRNNFFVVVVGGGGLKASPPPPLAFEAKKSLRRRELKLLMTTFALFKKTYIPELRTVHSDPELKESSRCLLPSFFFNTGLNGDGFVP